MASFANVQADLSGSRPQVSLLPGTNINYAPGGLANPTNYRYQFIMDHLEDSEAEQLAYRADMEYEFENMGWLDSIKVGYRRAEREQLVQWSGYNWQNVANVWSSNGGYYNVTDHAPAPRPTRIATARTSMATRLAPDETRTFSGDYFNLSGDQFVFFNMDLAQNREGHGVCVWCAITRLHRRRGLGSDLLQRGRQRGRSSRLLLYARGNCGRDRND